MFKSWNVSNGVYCFISWNNCSKHLEIMNTSKSLMYVFVLIVKFVNQNLSTISNRTKYTPDEREYVEYMWL